MKKTTVRFFCVLLASVITALSVPFMGAHAEEKAVYYVKDGGTGDGSSPGSALPGMTDAFNAIGRKNDGVIVICGNYTPVLPFEEPDHEGHVTVTMVYGGVDYRTADGIPQYLTVAGSASNHYFLNGDTTFEYLNLYINVTWVMRACFNHLTFGWGVDVAAGNLYAVGGDNGTSNLDTGADTRMTLLSGTFLEVIGQGRSTTQNYPGTAYITIGGTAVVKKLIFGNRSSKSANGGGAYITLDGGRIDYFAASNDLVAAADSAVGNYGDTTIKITANFKADESFEKFAEGGYAARLVESNTLFCGLSGTCVYQNNIIPTRHGEVILDYSENNLSDGFLKDKVLSDSFTRIIKYDPSVKAETTSVPPAPQAIPYTSAPAQTTAVTAATNAETTGAAAPGSETTEKDTQAATATESAAENTAAGTTVAETTAAAQTTKGGEASASSGGISNTALYIYMAALPIIAIALILILGRKKPNL